MTRTSNNSLNGREITQIMQNLRRRGSNIETAAKAVWRESAEEVVRTAKFLAPVRTGKLMQSIHAETENDGLTYKIVADATNAQGVPYGKFVEYDPRIAHPFLFPAIEQLRARIDERIKQAVQRRL